MKTVFICLLSLLLSFHQWLYAQSTDQAGWTVLDPTHTKKILYVSTSTGSDASGTVYSFPSGDVGNDPLLPVGNIQPFKTVAGAATKVSDGEAAWILLKRGDTFYEGLPKKQGRSVRAPLVYSYYGSEGDPPLLKTGNQRAIDVCCDNFANFWVVGLSFYAHTRNPNDADYGGTKGESGIRILAPPGVTVQNILIEGCTFRYYTNHVVQGKGSVTNVTLRRNGIFSNYSTTGHSQGLFSENLNGLVLEENTFDHNGWYRQSVNADNSKAGGQATIFNHDAYLANMKNVRCEGNAFYRPSSIGTKWTANNGPASVSGIKVINNLYHDCEVAIEAGGNKRVPSYRFNNVEIVGNVISSPGQSAPTNRTLGWGIEVDDWDTGQVQNNLIVHQNREAVKVGRGIILRGKNRNTTIRGNVLYDLNNTTGFRIEHTYAGGITIFGNVVDVDLLDRHFVESQTALSTYPFRGNTYIIEEPTSRLFKIGSGRMSLEDWKSATGETNLTTTAPTYPHPGRSVEAYVAQVLGLPDMETFYQELRKQSKLAWRTAYTAKAINSWIRAGFALDTDTAPTNPPRPTSSQVSIRAKGSVGSEQMSLWIADKKVQSWTVATTPTTYSYPDYTGGVVRVSFDNDGGSGSSDRNLAINHIRVCGTMYQSNAVGVVRTGCGVDNDKGFAWLWCSGSFDFGEVGCSASARTVVSEGKGADKKSVYVPESFGLYPNPASEQLTIEAADQENYQITMYDLTGRLMLQHDHLKGKAKLDIRHLQPGLYLIKLRDSEQGETRQRVIVE